MSDASIRASGWANNPFASVLCAVYPSQKDSSQVKWEMVETKGKKEDGEEKAKKGSREKKIREEVSR